MHLSGEDAEPCWRRAYAWLSIARDQGVSLAQEPLALAVSQTSDH